MKKNIIPVILLSLISIYLVTGCKKETTTDPGTPSPLSSQPVVINIFSSFNGTQCVAGWGLCISKNFTSRTQFADYKLQANEGKGEAWAETASQGVNFKINIPATALSSAAKDSLIYKKKWWFIEDAYIPQALINSTYKNAGITNIPSSLIIPKGVYPVTITGPVPPGPGSECRIIITLTIYYDSKGKFDRFEIKIEIVDP